MYCSNCGKKVGDLSNFCQNCGVKIEMENKVKEEINPKSSDTPNIYLNNEALFYSEDWLQCGVIVISSIPRFDILITQDSLYLIKIPSSHSGTIGFFLGFMLASVGGLLLGIIGSFVGYYIGDSNNKRNRRALRTVWLDSDHKLISKDYEKSIFLKIPLNKLKNGIVFLQDKFIVITYNGINIKFKNNKSEVIKLQEYTKSLKAAS